MTTTTITQPTEPQPTATDWPADHSGPEGVPLNRWAKAVAIVRSQAAGAPSYWPLWCKAYRACLRGHADARAFYGLFSQYQQAGGRHSPFDRSPTVAVDASNVVETGNEPTSGRTLQAQR